MISPEILRRFPHFAMFSNGILADLAMVSERRPFQLGEWILTEGNTARALCLLLSGAVDVAYRIGNGDIAVSDTITCGEAFAWSAILAPHTLTANCIGSKSGEYIAIQAEELREICSKDPVGAHHLMMEVAKTMRERIIGLRVQIAANTPKFILAEV